MQNKKQTVVNVIASLITLSTQLAISFWLSPYVIEKLGEEAFGFINLANNFVSYAGLIAVAVNSMANRFISLSYNSGRKDDAEAFFSSVFLINCILFLLVFLLSIAFTVYIDIFLNISPYLITQVKLTFFLSFLNMGFSLIGTVYNAAAYTTNKMYYSSLVQILGNVIKGILIFLLFALFPAKIYYLSLATLLGGLLILAGNFKVTKKLLPKIQVRLKEFDLSKVIQLSKSGIWLLTSNISNLFLNGLDLLFSNWFINAAIMGRLSISKQIPYAMAAALSNFSNIFSSSLTKVFSSKNDLGVAEEATAQLKILTFLFTTPYAGIIVLGYQFLSLWLSNTEYSSVELREIYYLMILVLLDIIVSTFMYSIHSVFIAMDAVKHYSITLFIASCVSIAVTLILLHTTKMGVYAIAGTSTVVLGFVHGIIIPIKAAKLQGLKASYYLKTEFKSWMLLIVLVVIFLCISLVLSFDNWLSFMINAILLGAVGYVISFISLVSKQSIYSLIKK